MLPMVIELHGKSGYPPAVADNPDLDALDDSRGARFQSIGTKLSSVIHQAGDSARDVAMQLRHRTQAAGRRPSFVMFWP